MLKGKGCTNIKKTEFKNKMRRTLVNTIRHYIYKIHVLFLLQLFMTAYRRPLSPLSMLTMCIPVL
jgi:sulfatase maturation enzyme AslB (radical SAM superfamily)